MSRKPTILVNEVTEGRKLMAQQMAELAALKAQIATNREGAPMRLPFFAAVVQISEVLHRSTDH